ncbi:hypothetical protein, partial [Stenotrophomonas maltophilia]|uniref:hypothetical protein n=1 Tax=Stenotrophomonas maltophilia TaxID=40324 RepID=UPI001954933A
MTPPDYEYLRKLLKDHSGLDLSADKQYLIERRLLPVHRDQGPDAVALTIGNPAAHKVNLLAYTPRLVKSLGSRNVM